MRYVVEPMSLEDIDEVVEIEKEAFTTAWSPGAYRRELLENRLARYIVLRELPKGAEGNTSEQVPAVLQAGEVKSGLQRLKEGLRRLVSGPETPAAKKPGRTVGYAGMWLMVDEAHLTTIAVRQEYKGRGLGELLLIKSLELAKQLGARVMTLEVRVSNTVAQSLYKKYGFQVAGVRRRYYTDNNEDALIMTTEELSSPEFVAKFEALEAANEQRIGMYDP